MSEAAATSIPDDATCLGCGYRLVNLPSQTCPECGRWFDPNDPTTFRSSSSPAGWRRWAKPPSLAECLILVGLSGYGVIGASGPAQWEATGVCMISFIGVPLWFGLVFAYFVRIAACWRDRDRAYLDRVKRSHRLRWVIAPFCVLLVLSSFVSPWPMMLRFRMSQNAFDTALKDYQAGKFSGNHWVGLYHVDHVHQITYLNDRPPSIGLVTGSSIGDPVGFAYDPLPNPPMGYKAVKVAPSWYSYED